MGDGDGKGRAGVGVREGGGREVCLGEIQVRRLSPLLNKEREGREGGGREGREGREGGGREERGSPGQIHTA